MGGRGRIQNSRFHSHWAIKTLLTEKKHLSAHVRMTWTRQPLRTTYITADDQRSGKQQLTEGNMIKFCLFMINRVWLHLECRLRDNLLNPGQRMSMTFYKTTFFSEESGAKVTDFKWNKGTDESLSTLLWTARQYLSAVGLYVYILLRL